MKSKPSMQESLINNDGYNKGNSKPHVGLIWLLVKVMYYLDAAFVDGQAAAAMVVRDDRGHLLYLASKLFTCVSAFVAEAEALLWASEYAKRGNWSRVEWETDSKEVEKAGRSEKEPTCWYAFHSICNICRYFVDPGWSLNWKSRRSNAVADAVAKMSFIC
ncbi:hypothetical protein FNV43_RR10035 [Rhamnella rubrinervis]|uniref:RNase H type-1 domain-containing protein n=1 Tax=Rhamnella rubrinervis TaxID=2594499 RepID=A0A8K0HB53_9ROSA|nr:hypothetical protein FNV43_RR10035 [Rhamnella rubrinervis]